MLKFTLSWSGILVFSRTQEARQAQEGISMKACVFTFNAIVEFI